jgi:hypothetical protein
MKFVESFFFAITPYKCSYKSQHKYTYKNDSARSKHNANIPIPNSRFKIQDSKIESF